MIVGHQFARKAGVSPQDVLGHTQRLDGRAATIVGVAPEGFSGTMALVAPEFWLPLGVYAKVTDEMLRDGGSSRLSDPKNYGLMLVGRLRAGVGVDRAQPMIAGLSTTYVGVDPVENKDHELVVDRLSRVGISNRPQTDSEVMVAVGLLMGMASLVLLTACLQPHQHAARANGDARNRAAPRAGGGRAASSVGCGESLLLAGVGSLAELLLATWGASLLVTSLSSALPFVVMLDTAPDLRVLAATIGFCALSTMISGLGPAWRVTRPDVLPDLKEQPAPDKAGRGLTMRNALVVGQIALSLALLTTAGLFMRGAVKAAVADPGFPLDGGVIVNVDAGMAGYDEATGRVVYLQRVRETPGVQSASFASLVPFGEVQRVATDARPARPLPWVSATKNPGHLTITGMTTSTPCACQSCADAGSSSEEVPARRPWP